MSETITAQIAVQVKCHFKVSPEEVFAAWLNPKWIGQWLIATSTEGEELVRTEIDARVGGRFSFLVQRRGNPPVDHTGSYLQLDKPRRLAFTWGTGRDKNWDSRVAVDFERTATGTALVLTHELPSVQWLEFAPSTAEAWTRKLLALTKILAGR